MEKLRVTVVGQEINEEVKDVFELIGLTMVNQVNTGMLGNLKTLTYTFEIEPEKVIDTRRNLMNELSKYSLRLMPMYVHGDWMRIFVFKTIRV